MSKRGIKRITKPDLSYQQNIKIDGQFARVWFPSQGRKRAKCHVIFFAARTWNTKNIHEGKMSDVTKVLWLEDEGKLMHKYGNIINFLWHAICSLGSKASKRHELKRMSKPYSRLEEVLYRMEKDLILYKVFCTIEAQEIMAQCHKGMCRGYFIVNTTTKWIIIIGYY